MSSPLRLAACSAALLAAFAAHAQQQVVRPPIALYWMDVATHTMAGMPEMPGMGGLSMPSFMGGGGAGGSNNYGNARGMAMGRWVDLALYTRSKPAGTDGTHAIPPGMQMGAGLPLVPVKAQPKEPREPGESHDEMPEKPTGRILVYWGCSETVRPGQPRVIDLATAGPAEFGKAFAGRYAPERGARVAPGYSLWPNEKNRANVPREASLVGDHAVSGEGVPASMKFQIGQMQDIMPAIPLTSQGTRADSVLLQWQSMPTARGYFLNAMGSMGKDLVLWSSSEVPDSGMGLLDYLSNTTIDRWIREKVLLPQAETKCAVPKGIFAGKPGEEDGSAMLRMIAYGNELNLVHPPRPTDPKTPWEQEWTVRVRVKSTTMAMLGEDIAAGERQGGRSRGSRGAAPTGTDQAPGQAPAQTEEKSLIPGLPGAGRAIDSIRSIFGR